MNLKVKVKPWLSEQQLFDWLAKSSDHAGITKRLAVWLVAGGKVTARQAAEILSVSGQAVWLWIRQYNSAGPDALRRKGRGGRRWAYMTFAEEAEFLRPFFLRYDPGRLPPVGEVKKALEKTIGRKVSLAYVYRLINRHGHTEQALAAWRTADRRQVQDTFKKISQPWLKTRL